MKGIITIQASEHGFGMDLDIEDVSLQDKFELMHSLSTALEMNEFEMLMYILLEQSGGLKEAELVHHCESEEEVKKLLQEGIADEG